MIQFRLKIFLSMYDKAVENAVKETALPAGIDAEFLPTAENKNAVPDDMTAVFITDKMSLLRTAVSFRKQNLKLVYCGYAVDADKYLNKLEALWPAGESAEIVKKRFTILMKNLKNESDAWFYQNTLWTAVQNLPFPTAVFSSDGKVFRMNHLFEELSGISSKHTEKFNYQEWKEKYLIPINPETQEYQINCNGTDRHFLIHQQEIPDSFQHISGYFLTMQEI